MVPPHRRLAVILDFDETLTDDSTSQLLKSHGVDVDVFWEVQIPDLINQGFDPTEAYMMLLVKEMRRRGKLEALRDERLREFGSTLIFHAGVIDFFAELRKLVAGRMKVQFFVISGGLQEIIAGSSIAHELDDFWGCTFYCDKALDIPYPKNVISFTEKTKYIFNINKGLIGARYKNKPYEVNEYMAPKTRHIPLENMFYIGDGLTDIPCFSILDNYDGWPVCVYNESRGRREGMQRAVRVTRHRGVAGPYKADYSRGKGLRDFLDPICEAMCSQ